MSYPVATALFDSAVNCGVNAASVWLQKSINKVIPNTLKVDGLIGPKTLAYLEAFPPFDIASKIVGFRLQRYVRLISRCPEQRVFVLGWMKRASDLLLFI
jgi:lysozyme family protein